jgi:predicted phosphodiesterase
VRCAARFPDLDVLVFGHSHIPWDTTAPGGLRLLNPGSPTDRRRQPHCTYLTAEVDGGRLADVVLHRLPPR